MPNLSYGTLFEQNANTVWSVIRDFGDYHWAGVLGETTIEDGKSGDAVGCIRNFGMNGRRIRQQLLAHSDLDRSYTYEFREPLPLPLLNFVATIRVIPITDEDRALVEWLARFDCAIDEIDNWTAHFMASFRGWLEALRTVLTG